MITWYDAIELRPALVIYCLLWVIYYISKDTKIASAFKKLTIWSSHLLSYNKTVHCLWQWVVTPFFSSSCYFAQDFYLTIHPIKVWPNVFYLNSLGRNKILNGPRLYDVYMEYLWLDSTSMNKSINKNWSWRVLVVD